jgi:Rhodopirellula transposase DDE domain/Acetyltransferase (GNAT) domain
MGVYDIGRNQGWVSVGIDHDTAEFAVDSIRHWWKRMGQPVYPRATELLITADSLATEAAVAWVRTAFEKLSITRLGAFVHPENIASIRVLEKVGFHAERQDVVMGIKAIVFSLDAKDGTLHA